MKMVLQRVKNGKIDYREEYLMKLMRQWKESIGKETMDINSEILLQEFYNWLKERQSILTEYKSLLDYMNIEYNNPMTAEIGKGIYDSIVKNISTTIITPYTYGLKNITKSKIIKGRLELVEDNSPKQDISINKETSHIDTLMTQNPYQSIELSGWSKLHHSHNYRIIIGVYGKNTDKDKEKKLTLLKTMRNILNENCKEEYIKTNDDYCYVVTTKEHSKIKLKRKK